MPKTYFVSKDGDDTKGDGSLGKPFETFYRVHKELEEDKVELRKTCKHLNLCSECGTIICPHLGTGDDELERLQQCPNHPEAEWNCLCCDDCRDECEE